ncbi:hypothetical protein ECG_03916 [Echinococcus granulosus]|uniref:Expressed conserved protein n=1 Tax=Echinococcus granulosus TaxID=6210 RepID=A0A068WCM9_ECHGR|nr:hypothetical protein ECG_03916 [Echinococcus granulosus]CDS17817.1 hypothetical protein EgrG_001058510 [Echinococcus granulosus]
MRRRSVYGHSYKPFECAQHLYQENLSFRLHKRLTQLSHQPFDWPDDTDSSSSPERILCGGHARVQGVPTCPLSPVPPSASDSPPCNKDPNCSVKRDESIQAGTALVTSLYNSSMSPSQQNLYISAGNSWLRNYKNDRKSGKKKCALRNTLAAEDYSLCAPKSACAAKCHFKTALVDEGNSVNPSEVACLASERDRAVENASITACNVDTAANASVAANKNKTPVSEVVASSDFSFNPKVKCSVALSSDHGSGRHSYRSSICTDSHVSAAYRDEASNSSRVCAYGCSQNSCRNHCH